MDIRKQVISGTKWTTAATLSTSVVHILRLVILTRFLDKADFGLVAILTFVLGLTQTFSDLGFSSAIMHKKNLTKNEFSSLYWIQFVLFVFFYIITCSCSGLAASFYGEKSLVYLIPLMMLDLLFLGVGKLYDVLLNKYMQFRTQAIRNILTAICSLVIAVILAYYKFGVYSLVISSLFSTISLQLWNLICGQRYIRVCAHCSLSEVKPLVKIGAFQMGTQLLDYLASKMDILILGKFLGTESLGIYNLAKELILKLVSVVNSIANKIAMPVFSIMQDDDEKMRCNYCRLISLLSKINFPICAFIGALSPLFIPILYGENYADVAPVTAILSIWGLIVCVANPVGSIVTAKGRTDLSFYYTVVRILIYLPAFYVLARCGIYYVACGQVIFSIVMLLVAWYLELYKTIKLGLFRYLRSFVSMFLVCAFLSILCFYSIVNNILGISNQIYQDFIYAGLTILLYGLFIILVNHRLIASKLKLIIQ